MSETSNPGAEGDTVPQLNALAQYTKDLSFENPNAPRSLSNQNNEAPNIQIQVNVNAQPIQGDDYEVELKLEGTAGSKPNLMFSFELNYAGVFRLRNIPQEPAHPVPVCAADRGQCRARWRFPAAVHGPDRFHGAVQPACVRAAAAGQALLN